MSIFRHGLNRTVGTISLYPFFKVCFAVLNEKIDYCTSKQVYKYMAQRTQTMQSHMHVFVVVWHLFAYIYIYIHVTVYIYIQYIIFWIKYDNVAATSLEFILSI